ncbi:MAG: ABC transporter permease [Cyclobacteriaceae bacterium]
MKTNTQVPPKLADQFLSWFCKGDLLEEIQGDLYEYFERINKNEKRWRVVLIYWFHVFNFLRPFAIRKLNGQNLNTITMLQSNITMAFRNLLKYKFYSGLNISGLALGLASCIFILIWVTDELSYDKFYENSERIYRVSSDLKFLDNKYDMAVTPAPMAEAFKMEFPEIIESGRLRNRGGVTFKKGDRLIDQDGVLYADNSILRIFSFEILHGDREKALLEPNTLVITESVAVKFFDESNPVGKSMESLGGKQFRIDAVIKDTPENSHFHPKMFISNEGDPQSKDGIWLSNNYFTYFLLDENNDPTALQAKFESVYPKYFGPQLEQFVGAGWDAMIQSGSHVNYFLVGLEDIHLYSHQDIEIEPNGDIQYVYMFGAIGLFILIIACINFMNISTARATIRGKEVGVRKVLGSMRSQLIAQFLTESVLFSFLALIIAVILTYTLTPFFENLTGKVVINPFFNQNQLWMPLIAGTFVIGLIAGIYPAFVLSGFKPVKVMKGQLRSGKSASVIRGVLVVFQFAMSIILIVGTVVVYKQLNFVQNKNLGFDKDGVIVLNSTATLGTKIQSFKEELLANPQIESVSVSGYLPTGEWRSDTAFQPEGASSDEDIVGIQVWGVDHDYVKTMGMEIVAGRDFSEDMVSDSTAVIMNMTAIKRFGYEENPIDKKIKPLGSFQGTGQTELTIIGVIDDFHYDSMHDNIGPLMIYLKSDPSVMAIRFNGENVKNVVAEIESKWSEFNPNHPLDYDFMDRQYAAKYEAEERLGTIFTVFGVFAILIACLGLFGLSSFTAEQRRKELGIRKVLGASVSNLLGLLFQGYTKLLVISIVLGLPIAYYLMNQWLQDFAYHTEIGIGLLVVSAFVAMVIAWLTVSFQSLRAARVNPADNLRYE